MSFWGERVMKGTLIRVSCTILSITLILSLAACAKQSSSQEPEPDSSSGANAQIIDGIFDTALLEIKKGDCNWAVNNHSGMKAVVVASYYELALDWLESCGLTNTPLYELALYRYNSAVLVWGID